MKRKRLILINHSFPFLFQWTDKAFYWRNFYFNAWKMGMVTARLGFYDLLRSWFSELFWSCQKWSVKLSAIKERERKSLRLTLPTGTKLIFVWEINWSSICLGESREDDVGSAYHANLTWGKRKNLGIFHSRMLKYQCKDYTALIRIAKIYF